MNLPQPPPLADDDWADLIGGIGVDVQDSTGDDVWLIPGFIHPGVTCITGQPESGKSTLVLSQVRSLLKGQRWLDQPTALASDARVLFGCEDATTVRRVRHLFASEVAARRLAVTRLSTWDNGRPRLTGAKLKDLNVGLVVIDTLFAAAGDANDQAIAANFVAALRDFEVPVLVVHHAPKGSSLIPAGAQAYTAAYRHTITVRKAEANYDRGVLTQWLDISGNDTEPSRVTIDTDFTTATTSTAAVDAHSSAGRRTRPDPSAVAAALGRFAAAREVAVDTETANAAAGLLVGDELNKAVGASLSHDVLRRKYLAVSKPLRSVVLAEYERAQGATQ